MNVNERFYSRNKRKQQHDVDNEDKEEQPLPYEIELEELAKKRPNKTNEDDKTGTEIEDERIQEKENIELLEQENSTEKIYETYLDLSTF